MSRSVTCPKCGEPECNEDRRNSSEPILCSYCGHVFERSSSEEEKEVVEQIITSEQQTPQKASTENYPIGVIMLGTINATFCFCDIFRELFGIAITDPLWGYLLIALSAMGLMVWGMAVKRYAFAAVFSFTFMMAVFYIWLPR